MTKIASNAKSLTRFGSGWAGIFSLMLAVSFCLGWPALQVHAQTAGQGALQGTVTDSTGAVIPNAAVKISNDATKIETTRSSNSTGLYVISPVQPGSYTVTISAPGFKTIVQQNVVVDALQTRVFNPALSVGQETETVEVTAAPPVLNTADATLGLTVENESYTNLPIQMSSGAQRDPTAFAALTPGAQGGTRMPIIGGTGNYLGQLYLEGMPATTVNQQGDNRVVSLSMSVEAVDQFQVLTSTPPAEYMGAGAMNFTMKSGGLKYHGQVNDYIRNTVFDSWCFTCKAATYTDASNVKHPAPKSTEHQNEFSASVGGVVPKTHDKLFFFFAYDKYYYRAGGNPQLQSIPTQPMLTGDFTELNGNVGGGGRSGTGSDNTPIIYDPTSNNCTGSVCTRTPFTATKNGVSTYNVIPSGMISPIAKAMASFMPAPSNASSLYNNYLGSYPAGRNNHVVDWRVDYNINDSQRISSVGVMGDVNYLNNFSTSYAMPGPYVIGTYANIHPKVYILEHVWTINPTLVNQVKFSFTRFVQPQTAATDGIEKYEPTTLGISNAPAGQASTTFPGAQFGTTTKFGTAYTMWTGNDTAYSTQMVNPSTYALTDNAQWVKGKHSIAFGFSYLWEGGNIAAPKGNSAQLSLNYNAYSTANYATNSSSLSTTSTGYSFASYMLGAVAGTTSSATPPTTPPSIALYPLNETGGRYHPFAPYIRDSIKINQKLTVEVGLRWDYLPPFHEVKDRWTFLNPALLNPLTSTYGMLQFAGNWGGSGVSYGSRTPVQTYWKNFGPRLGFAYSVNPKTVIRSGFAVVYSQAGGVGGRGGYGTGTGQTGFNMTANGTVESTSGVSAAPSYWLNNGTSFTNAGLSSTNLLGSSYTFPSVPTPGLAAQESNTGNYYNGTKTVSAGTVSYADPYFSGRAPEIVLWNLGFERTITPDLTLGVNYAGNESHFIVNAGTTKSNARGYWTNQTNPKYLAVLAGVTGKSTTGSTVPILNAPATAANAAIVSSYFPTAPAPAFITNTGTTSIAQMLTAFPQYSTVNDTWGNVGNFTYHALQLTLNERMHKGLSFNVNYTFSKNLGDDGTFRSGFDIPAAAISGGTKAYKQNRIDRSWTNMSVPHTIHAYGVYQLPFGKDKIGSNSTLVRWLAGGWQFSGIYTFSSGTPLAVTWSGSSSVGQGQAMPDLNPAFTGKAKTNKYGWTAAHGYDTCNMGINAYGQTGCTTKAQYLDVNAFKNPTDATAVSGQSQYLIGNAPRTLAYKIRNPYTWNVDAGMRRSIPLSHGVEFVFEADAINVWNHVTFDSPNAAWAAGSTTFGTITKVTGSPRDWQFAGHIKF